MFSNTRFFGYPKAPEYTNYAALAEARAAEAAAKAAEAEYYAMEAYRREHEARLRAQSAYWAPYDVPSLPCYTNQVAAAIPCNCCPGTAQASFGVPYARRTPLNGPDYDAFATPHAHRHHEPQHFPPLPLPLQPSPAERVLEAKLQEERIARFKLEQELKKKELELSARQRVPISQVSVFACAATPYQREAPKPKATFVAPASAQARAHPWSQWMHGEAAPKPKPRPQPTPAPRRPAQETVSDDFITNFILQSILSDARDTQETPSASRSVKEKATQAPQHATPNKAQHGEVPTPLGKTPSHEGSLIEQLQARYQQEGEDEIRDTIQALVNSLLPQPAPSTQPKNTSAHDTALATLQTLLTGSSTKPSARSTSQTKPTSSASTAGASSTKGKDKEESPAPTTISTSKDVLNALERVERIEHTFHSLEADFTFPAHLDFIASPTAKLDDTSAIFPHLAFTARNHPVRYYEQTLSSLLQQLDLIESYGNASLRLRRKLTVRSIEQALEELEREVAGRWKASVAKAQENETTSEPSSPKPSPAVSAPVETPTEKNPSQSIRIRILDAAKEPGSSSIPSPIAEAAETVEELAEDNDLSDPSSDDSFNKPKQEVPVEAPDVVEVELADNSDSEPMIDQLSETIVPIPSDQSELASSPSDVGTLSRSTPEAVPEIDTFTSSEAEAPKASPTSSQPQHSQDSTDDSDGFLLAQPRSPVVPRRTSVEVEDLGSDWSDVDA